MRPCANIDVCPELMYVAGILMYFQYFSKHYWVRILMYCQRKVLHFFASVH